jgi:hypothetical protein
MALSGTVKTNVDSNGRYYQLSWTATQSTANNTSTISWTLSAQGYSGGWVAERTLYVTIDGATVYNKSDRVERKVGTIKTGTKTITHNSNGSRSFTITIGAAVYGTSVNCKGSGTFALNTIGRASTLNVSGGTLGVAQTITADRKVSSFTHTLTWECGSYSGTIATKSTATSWSFTPPLELANTATQLFPVGVYFKLTTYNGSTVVGTSDQTVIMKIPTSIKPTCTVNITDPTGYSATYGGYVQNKSKMKITVTATPAYGSPIASYSIIVNKNQYNYNPATTGVITTSGSNTIIGKATDKRNRTGSVTTTINVLAYNSPKITFTMHRCDQDGTENMTGSYCKVSYKAVITSLSNKNSKSIKLRYKKTSDTTYTFRTINMESYTQEGSEIFSAEDGSSYNVQMQAIDSFETSTTTAELSTGFSIMHIAASGRGLAIGKISQSDEFEVGMDARFYSGAHFNKGLTEDMPLIADSDCNNIITSGHYYAYNNTINKPEDKNGWLTVKAYQDGSYWCHQEFITYDGHRYFRHKSSGTWGNWISLDADYVLETGETKLGWNYRKWANGTIELWDEKLLSDFAITDRFSRPASGTTVPADLWYYGDASVNFDSDLLTNVKNVQITLNRNAGLYFPKIRGYTTSYIKFHVVGLMSETVAISAHIYVIGTWK